MTVGAWLDLTPEEHIALAEAMEPGDKVVVGLRFGQREPAQWSLRFLGAYADKQVAHLSLRLPSSSSLEPIRCMSDSVERFQLSIEEDVVVDLSVLGGFHKLVGASISVRPVGLRPFADLAAFRVLTMDGGRCALEEVRELEQLIKLNLHAGPLQRVEALREHPRLESLSIYNGGILSDLSPVASLPRLAWLCLSDLRRVSVFPDLREMPSFRAIWMERMHGLRNFESVAGLELEQFVLLESRVPKEALSPLERLLALRACVWRMPGPGRAYPTTYSNISTPTELSTEAAFLSQALPGVV